MTDGIAGLAFTTLEDYKTEDPTYTVIPIDDVEAEGTTWPQSTTEMKPGIDGTDKPRGKKYVGALAFGKLDASYLTTLDGYVSAETRIVIQMTPENGDPIVVGADPTTAANSKGVILSIDDNMDLSFGGRATRIMGYGTAIGRGKRALKM